MWRRGHDACRMLPTLRTVYLGRQPIFSSELKPVAYELFYRACASDRSDQNGVWATANVTINASLEMGVQRVVGKARAFIHVTPEILDDDLLRLFDPAQLMLQLMPDFAYDDHVLVQVDRLRSAGYGISVDDLLVHEGTLPSLERAHFVKVDLNAVPMEELAEHVAQLRRHPLAVVAERWRPTSSSRAAANWVSICIRGTSLPRRNCWPGALWSKTASA